jgi:predicted metal-dependent enzyme (double-stranded beta helix superfamily)
VALSKLASKPLVPVLGFAGGLLATAAFRQVWKLVAGEVEAPDATDEHRGWGEVLAAAALQGAIFAVVKAAVDRAGATGIRHLTGEWPA